MAWRAGNKASTDGSATIQVYYNGDHTTVVPDGDKILLVLSLPGLSTAPTVTWPSGFTQTKQVTNTPNNGGWGQMFMAENPVASSEPTSYTVSHDGFAFNAQLFVDSFSGRETGQTNSSRVIGTAGPAGSGSTPVSIPLTGLTVVTGDDGAWYGAVASGGGTGSWVTTAPTSPVFTSRRDDTSATDGHLLNLSTRDAMSSGAISPTGLGVRTGGSGDSFGIFVALAVAAAAGQPTRSRFRRFGNLYKFLRF